MNYSKRTSNDLKKSALDGAINALAGAFLFGDGNIEYFGMSVPAYAALFATGTVSSFAVYKIHDAYMPGMNIDQMTGISAAMPAAAVGLANVAAFKLAGSLESYQSALKLAALGAASNVSSGYVGRVIGLL